MHIKTASFSFNVRVLEPIILPPYKGSTLGGGFGYAFKRVACAIKDKNSQIAYYIKIKCLTAECLSSDFTILMGGQFGVLVE